MTQDNAYLIFHNSTKTDTGGSGSSEVVGQHFCGGTMLFTLK